MKRQMQHPERGAHALDARGDLPIYQRAKCAVEGCGSCEVQFAQVWRLVRRMGLLVAVGRRFGPGAGGVDRGAARRLPSSRRPMSCGSRSVSCHADGAGARGSRTVNVLPLPGPSLDACTVPP